MSRGEEKRKQIGLAVATVIAFVAGFLGGYVTRGLLVSGCAESEDRGEAVKFNVRELGKREEKEAEDLKDVCEMWVDLSGAVVNPGVYCIREGMILDEVLVEAGGYYEDLYAFKFVAQQVNRARKLQDQEKIYIPFEDDVVCKHKQLAEDPSGVNEDTSDAGASDDKDLQDNDLQKAMCVSLNKASKDELETLSGVGPSTAQKIVDGRPYTKLEDLLNVSGIGDATYARLEPYICL